MFIENDSKFAKVSIVMPTYNGAKFIHQSIDSCLNQTYKDIELIIVDDGSVDETPEIIKSYEDKRIKYIKHNENKGLPNALNTGFKNATGEYLTWTSDDNYYVENAIEEMELFLNNKRCFFVYCNFYKFNESGHSDQKIIELSGQSDLKYSNNIGPCFLYSKEVKETIGEYDTETMLAEDYDYWIRVSKKYPMCHLKKELYHYRIHEKSLFSTRYKEIQIVALLVRIKNDIISTEEGTDLFINTVAKFEGNYRLNKYICNIFVLRNIETILKDYKSKKISFAEAKKELRKVIEKIPAFVLNPNNLKKKIKFHFFKEKLK